MLFLRKYILAAIALALSCSQTLISPSLADSPEFRRVEISGGINAATLYVNQDGDRWTQIVGYEGLIPLHVTIEMSKGYIEFYRIGRNLTDGAVRGILLTHHNNSSGTPYERNVDSSTSVNETADIAVGGGRRLNPTDEQAIVGRCNSKLAEINSGHHFSYVIPLALHADAKRRRRHNTPFDITHDDGTYRGYGDSARATATGTVSIRIECLKNEVTRDTTPPSNGGEPRSGDKNIPKTPANKDLGFDHGAMKVKDIKLTFTTFQNGYTEPTPGTRCKKARLRVRLETNQKGLVSFKLWQQRGGGSISNKDYIIGTHHDGNGRFFAQKDIEVRVYKTTLVQANAKELISETFKKETGWRKIHLICKGASGNGGLATPDNDNDNRDVPKSVFTGGFEFIDNSAKAKQNKCSRKAKALIWFTNKKASNIHFSLDCGGLGNFSGTLTPKSIGDGKYRGAKLIPFTIEKSIQAGCTLRTVAPGQPRNHAFQARDFVCHKPAGHGSGSGLAIPPRPIPETPKTGGGTRRIIDPVRAGITCHGGKVRRKRCLCSSKTKSVRVGKNVFKCIKRPTRVNPQPPKRTKPIVCLSGKVQGRRCLCPANTKRKGIGRNKYRCVKQQLRIKCVGGKVRGVKCICPPRKKLTRKRRGTFVCIKRAARRINPLPPKKVRPRQPRRVRSSQPRRVQPRRCPRGKIRIRGRCRRF